MTARDLDALVDFWFDSATADDPPPFWFDSDATWDAEIARRFGGMLKAAAVGVFDDLALEHRGALGLVLVFDQLPRNIHRGTPAAFAFDPQARRIARHALYASFDLLMGPLERQFLYMPFMHSEDLADQDLSAELFAGLDIPDALEAARRHHAVIARFGRFPTRNAILGRQSTPQELAWLQADGRLA